MRTIRLYGELGRLFGEVHQLNVRSPAEAIRALCANFPKFKNHLLSSQSRNVGYRVIVDTEEVGTEELANPFSREINLVPEILGASSSFGKILIGAVLIAAAVVIGVGSAGTAGAISGVLLNVGVGFIAGGILQAITPVPNTDPPQEASDTTPSYIFNGAVNTTAQRQPIPIGYGRMIVGSAVISAGISTEDISSNTLLTPTLNTAADDSELDYGPAADGVV